MPLADNNVLTAFQIAAGVSADKLNLLIRTLLLVVTFLWAAWCVYGEVNHFRHHEIEIDIALRKITRILILVALMVVLVFIPNGE